MATRFESPISFVTRSSSPTTPSSGYGLVYSSGSNLFYEDDTATEYLLTRAGTRIVKQYTGSTFWIKPVGIAEIFVACLGAGGGGGSGEIRGAGLDTSGGGAGGGGALNIRRLSAAQLTATSYSISIGAGGAGALAQTTDSTFGITGSAGTDTTFAISGSTVLVRAKAGTAGKGGVNGSSGFPSPGGSSQTGIPVGCWYSWDGDSGFPSDATGQAVSGSSVYLCNGGGPGGPIAINLRRAGAPGAALTITGSIFAANNGGSVSSPNATTNTSRIRTDFLFNFGFSDNLQYGIGFAGGGGAAGSGSFNGGSGSAAAPYSGGGGGGGAARNGFDSGPGGRGGDGLVTIIEYY